MCLYKGVSVYIADLWTTQVSAVQVHIYVDFFPSIQYSTINVFSPPCDFLYISFSLFFIRIQYIISIKHNKVCVTRLFMLSVKFPVISKPFVVK